MSEFNSLGLGRYVASGPQATPIEYVIVQRPLDPVLAFTRRSIDDVVNSPIVKNEVYGYYKLQKWVERGSEIVDLEQHWNPLGRRG